MESLKLHVTHESAGTEGGRRPTGGPAEPSAKPDPEVVFRPHRRNLTVAYKLKILETVAALREQGQGAVGAYLRKEGLYYSSIRSWERLRGQGLLTSTQKGPKEKNRVRRKRTVTRFLPRTSNCAVSWNRPKNGSQRPS